MRGITWPNLFICAFATCLWLAMAYALECNEQDDTARIVFVGDANGFVIEGIQGRILSRTDDEVTRRPFDEESKEPRKPDAIIPDDFTKTVMFEIPLPIIQCAIQSSGTNLGRNEALVLELFLENGQKYEHAGYLSFSDAKINYISGALTFKVQLPNPHAVLVAGMKVLCNLRNDKTASVTVSTETH